MLDFLKFLAPVPNRVRVSFPQQESEPERVSGSDGATTSASNKNRGQAVESDGVTTSAIAAASANERVSGSEKSSLVIAAASPNEGSEDDYDDDEFDDMDESPVKKPVVVGGRGIWKWVWVGRRVF
ncbi:hypothetical protein L1987_77886 [Smallanthus sonchifolius]|uniref:Uncharacterized protein n=1 Tax=Smallanthus sonchifolius TaxID=185202 RepID=A0ACB8ZBC2_9ASTR|nr:hypothetical protein L1987_77886 [Smallanthus sonchifolius]